MRTERAWKLGLAAVVAAGAGLSGGCSTMSDTAKGAGIGGAIGTAVGLGIGAATGNPKTGAVVGGLAGAGLGGAVGNASDNEKAEKREQRATEVAVAQANAAAQQRQLGMMDVVGMVQAGQSEAVVINQIRSTGSTFNLAPADLDFMKRSGVSDTIIIEMQTAKPVPVPVVAAPMRPRTVVYERPAPVYVVEQPAPVYVMPPPRPRPVVFGATYISR